MNSTFYFQELTCLPDTDVNAGFVMGKVMDAVHLRLVAATAGTGSCPVGLSFPEYQAAHIGSRVRLFARNAADLEQLELRGHLDRLRDYVHLTSVRQLERRVPKFAVYRRYQPQASKERLIRRQVKRSGLSELEIRGRYANFSESKTRLPYINLRSLSTSQSFRLFVDRQIVDCSEGWGFSTYGFSRQVAVPEF